MFYISHSVHYVIVRRCAGILRENGFEVVLIDLSNQPNGFATDELSYPCVRLQDVESGDVAHRGDRPAIELRYSYDGDLPVEFESCHDELSAILGGAVSASVKSRLDVHKAVWSHLRPRVVVAVNEGYDTACLALAAKESHIPSVMVPHAATQAYKRTYGFSAVALFGPDIVDAHRTRESPPRDCALVAVGACRFDDILLRKDFQEHLIRQQLDLPPSAPIVCFASDWILNEAHLALKKRALQWLAEALQQDAVLVVKKHPLEKDAACERTLGDRLDQNRYRITDDSIDLYGLLATSNVLVTLWSNIGYEAILLKKPVVVIDNAQADSMYYVKHALAAKVRNGEQLASVLAACVREGTRAIPGYDKNRDHFIRRCLVADDGKASERLADLIGDLASGDIPARKSVSMRQTG
ncbi:MAG: CDP-glycerol glycerophosphotransferase family protein [Phycisphaerae bacterium]|nr:CDP-glycerol glycerophosphotransferase family protein [Phycisphaerae bacterium]